MSVEKKYLEHIEALAKESLGTFSQIADAAEAKLASVRNREPSDIARNTFTDTAAVNSHSQINHELATGYEKLKREPAVARVVVTNDDGKKRIYYISRPTNIEIPDKSVTVASYYSQAGRLAALSVGSDYHLPNASGVVSENARFNPQRDSAGWDSIDTILQGEKYKRLTIESLRALYKQEVGEEIDLEVLDRLLAAETESANVREGVRRKILEKMGLRDQPILDQIQDEIFRLPLDRRLLILGAPGTGKTTTLIKRLRQKLDTAFLTDDEKSAVNSARVSDGVEHATSWMMFTPTELLRLYVKEAFNREGVAAPDERILTWNNFRDDIARNRFGILRTPNGGQYVLKADADILSTDVIGTQIAWFEDFERWYKTTFYGQLLNGTSALAANPSGKIAALGTKLRRALEGRDAVLPSTFDALAEITAEIIEVVAEMKAGTDKKIRGALNLQLNRNGNFLADLRTVMEAWEQDGADDGDDADTEDDDEAAQPRTGLAVVAALYMQTVRAQARAKATRRALSKNSRSGKIVEWIGDRTLNDQDLVAVGESVIVQTELRRFVNPVRRYVDRLPSQYRTFRRMRQVEKKWYKPDGFSATDLHPLELDLVLLAVLKETSSLVVGLRRLAGKDSPAYATLSRLTELYCTQILVDEATDFSPLQLASMASLARPGVRSFFACGDFNQRVTRWGVRRREEVTWAVPGIATRTVAVAYRQSKQLHDLSKQIVAMAGGEAADVALPPYVDSEGPKPVLAKNLKTLQATVSWLAQRITEIEKFAQKLPSIAILVNNEDELREIAKELGAALSTQSINVVPCPDGQVKGHDNDVRVFDVQHIKGLEFEAVFFIGIDQLAARYPDLFDKYLYVGATRAATYLAVTSNTTLPGKMKVLEPLFDQDWRH